MLNNYPPKLVIPNGKNVLVSVKKYVPLKTKVICGKHRAFITREMRIEIVKQPALKKRSNTLNNLEVMKLYKKQRNHVVNLSVIVKTENFWKHIKHNASSKNSWKFCKPFFSKRTSNFSDLY